MIGTDRLSAVFVELADTLVADFDLVDFLQGLTRHVADISGTQTVGLMLSDGAGALHYMASSTGDAKALELLQIQHDEGPCVDCHRTGAPVVNVELADAGDLWPRFAPRAVEAGFHAVHAFPMRLRDDVIGAINVFSEDPEVLDEDDVTVIQSLTDVATISIIQERVIARVETLAEQLQGALNSRIAIEQAKGAVARTLGISVDEAFVLIRSHARSHGTRLTVLAHDLVTDPGTMAELGTPAS
jgi:GAF domain-containing protein